MTALAPIEGGSVSIGPALPPLSDGAQQLLAYLERHETAHSSRCGPGPIQELVVRGLVSVTGDGRRGQIAQLLPRRLPPSVADQVRRHLVGAGVPDEPEIVALAASAARLLTERSDRLTSMTLALLDPERVRTGIETGFIRIPADLIWRQDNEQESQRLRREVDELRRQIGAGGVRGRWRRRRARPFAWAAAVVLAAMAKEVRDAA